MPSILQRQLTITHATDVQVIRQYALKVFYNDWDVGRSSCQLKLASSALLLRAEVNGTAQIYGLPAAVFSAFSAYLNKGGAAAQLKSLVLFDYANPDSEPEYMHMSRLILNFCGAAIQYSRNHVDIALSARSLSRISTVLRGVCSCPDYGQNGEMVEARGFLDELDDNLSIVRVSTGLELLVEGWDGYLAALVIAQDIERVTEESILESAMEGLQFAESRLLQPIASNEGNDDEQIGQDTYSVTAASRTTSIPCSGTLRIASAMPRPI